MKRIYFTVTNDLAYDQRMIRICGSLAAAGYSVVLAGRRLPGSIPLRKMPFEQKRIFCLFRRGKLFYFEFNLRLLFFLLFRKMDALCAVDLDTILPCLLVSRWKKIPRIHDAHELFSEMKEVIARPAIRNFWTRVEAYAVPQFAQGYTVSQSIAEEFRKRYGVEYELIRNVPVLVDGSAGEGAGSPNDAVAPPNEVVASPNSGSSLRERSIAADATGATSGRTGGNAAEETASEWMARGRFILYQGAVNEARGLESLIPAMRQVDSRLLICGTGNRMEHCRKLVEQYSLADKVVFMGPVEPSVLREITGKAYIGINLVERFGLNQYYSLANKFFDYIHAELPQVTMDFPEYRRVNDQYAIGVLIGDTDEKKITDALNNLLENDVLYLMFKENCRRAQWVYNWQQEEKKLLRFYQKILG